MGPQIIFARIEPYLVELFSTLCRDNRDFRDCRHAFLTVSTEISLKFADFDSVKSSWELMSRQYCRKIEGPIVDSQVSFATTALISRRRGWREQARGLFVSWVGLTPLSPLSPFALI